MVAQITLYTAEIFPFSHRAELALEEAKVSYNRFEIDLNNKLEWYAPKVNPASKVPAFAYGGPQVSPDLPSPDSDKIAESHPRRIRRGPAPRSHRPPLARQVDREISAFTHTYSHHTNRYLRRIALDRIVWVALVEDLWLRGFVDRLSAADIRASSAERLIGLVKKMLTGPESWPTDKRRSTSRPWAKFTTRLLRRMMSWIPGSSRQPGPPVKTTLQVAERVSIHPQFPNHLSPLYRLWNHPTVLLPGAKYFLFCGTNQVHYWAVDTDVWLWSHETSAPAATVHTFNAEVVNDGKNATVVVCFKTHFLENVVNVVDLDLETGISQTLLTVHIDEARFYLIPSICGNIIALSIGSEYFLINWRTHSYCKLSSRLGSGLSLSLIPGYMVLLTFITSACEEPTAGIRICAVAMLSLHWRRTEDSDAIQPTSVDTLPVLLLRPFPLPPDSKYSPTMTLHESPLQPDLYRLWVYSRWSEESSDAVRRSYHLVLDRTGIALHQRTEEAAELRWHSEWWVWYSGHRLLTYLRGGNRISPPGLEPKRSVALSATHRYLLDMSPYGGALMYASNSTLVIDYYA
ncbi:hypothetical protein C8R44DRAFT_885390 [Mycena epipterygia]|nr:hypothetical protein C8R44DRAFT_885390 [Mycena epipterygia]